MIELILATQNRDKVKELAHALEDLEVRVLSYDDVGGWPEIEETGETLEENARLKARVVSERFGKPTLADDTGLEVDALHGAPGVYSARFAGPEATYADNVAKLLKELDGVPKEKRTARFRCAIALVDPEKGTRVVEGAVAGRITTKPRGAGGFGYDPVFLCTESGRTFAEMTTAEKRGVSHRGRALDAARELLQQWYLHNH
ncbi:MAG: XTP/dITP diphosphatase [Candidatus Eisenbacteria bacterium]|uniref:dITP/XTP pyrophosphatase n=1 Tax=Eiseniibacteriota bacterium TaxID=2212470 RepID=A0A956NGC2_UNCEI|nr:XTP/dITP diphosphatase [Candidatus Eisenbacteria bacterium]MCB9462135.1 XTP/dITP diphosphatase [Candidatus Eisenbacteria bacterium]